ncbi:MAG: sigma-70 family RNA polymerase sigma factor [Anaerolineae bacterium]|nr:sigma-70 family RNA polymerase sigma factor [Anaerolineae bacterium]
MGEVGRARYHTGQIHGIMARMCARALDDVAEWQTAVHAALSAWGRPEGDAHNRLEELTLVQERRAALTGDLPATLRLVTNEVLLACLQELAQQDADSAHILTWRFLEGEIVQQVANRLHLGTDQLKRRQNRAIQELTTILLAREQAARTTQAQRLESLLLPPTYHTLFGVDETLPLLVELLRAPAAPWVVAVTGIGGIGKTSLVNVAVRQLIPHFCYEKIVWLAVTEHEQRETPLTADWLMSRLAPAICPLLPTTAPTAERDWQVRQTLKLFPTLVILDNLESEMAPDLAAVLPDLAPPGKFVLTNRLRPSPSANIHLFPVPELDTAAALALLRDQAQLIGAHALSAAPDAELQAIYVQVGGNPLALKLIAGLSQDFSLPDILADLSQAQLPATEALYRHIYSQTWQVLSQPARQLLEIMPLAADTGATLAQLQAVSGLEPAHLLPAIQELIHRSLLEVRGSLNERRYALHSLTRIFLLRDISHWPENQ